MSWSVFSQSTKALPTISEQDFIQDFGHNLLAFESDLRKVPADTLLLSVHLLIDAKGKVFDGFVENDVYQWTPIVKKSLYNLPKFQLPDVDSKEYFYAFDLKYPNPFYNDGLILEPKYPEKGGVEKLFNRFADEMDVYFRLENIGKFTLVYYVETDGSVKDFVYEQNASKALKNYTKRFFKHIEKFEPAYQFQKPLRHKMSYTFTIVD